MQKHGVATSILDVRIMGEMKMAVSNGASKPHWLLQSLRWDLRAALAVGLGLIILVGWSLAATDALYAFDFGTASFADLNSGDIRVSGGTSIYPQTSGTLTFGWVSPEVTEFSSGTSVADKRNRDRNGGQPPNTFKIAGLPTGTYKFTAIVGDSTETISTRMVVGDRATSLTKTASWGTMALTSEVVSGTVEINFSSADVSHSWGINALLISPATGLIPQPGFSLTIVPASQQLTAGGIATFNVGITPLNNYTNQVTFSVTDLVAGVSAEFVPPTLTSVPGNSELQLSTLAGVPPTTYTVLVRAVGSDSQAVTKTASVQLVVVTSGQLPTDGQAIPPTSEEPIVSVRTDEQVQDEFALVDAYVKQVEDQQLVKPKDFSCLHTISDTMSSFPLGTFLLPPPKTGLEASLQFLTRSGIIDSVLSTAPRSDQREPEPIGFWARFWSSISSPVQ